VSAAEWGVIKGWLPEPNGRLIEELTAQRDLARDLAIALESQLAAAAALHRAEGEPHCVECDAAWPCPTILALDPES
jgi:hypothetical protein